MKYATIALFLFITIPSTSATFLEDYRAFVDNLNCKITGAATAIPGENVCTTSTSHEVTPAPIERVEPGPKLYRIEPNKVRNDKDHDVMFYGDHFDPICGIMINGEVLCPPEMHTYISPQQLKLKVTKGAAEGIYSLSIINKDLRQSDPLLFTIQKAGGTGGPGGKQSAPQTITHAQSGFGGGTSVSINLDEQVEHTITPHRQCKIFITYNGKEYSITTQPSTYTKNAIIFTSTYHKKQHRLHEKEVTTLDIDDQSGDDIELTYVKQEGTLLQVIIKRLHVQQKQKDNESLEHCVVETIKDVVQGDTDIPKDQQKIQAKQPFCTPFQAFFLIVIGIFIVLYLLYLRKKFSHGGLEKYTQPPPHPKTI